VKLNVAICMLNLEGIIPSVICYRDRCERHSNMLSLWTLTLISRANHKGSKRKEMLMKLRKAVLALALFALLAFFAVAEDDVSNISKETMMTPNVPSKESAVRITPSASGSLANVAGIWSLDLNDAMGRKLELNLYQNNDAVFGSGNITLSGGSTPVSAGGTLKGNSLALYVIPSGDPRLYTMTLTVGQGSVNGNYVFSSPGAAQQPGVASGRLTQSRSLTVVKSVSIATQMGAGQSSYAGPQGSKGSAG
jgi:hypothetical protein